MHGDSEMTDTNPRVNRRVDLGAEAEVSLAGTHREDECSSTSRVCFWAWNVPLRDGEINVKHIGLEEPTCIQASRRATVVSFIIKCIEHIMIIESTDVH